jgi:hypothetical protein
MSLNILSDPKPWFRGIEPGDIVTYARSHNCGNNTGKATICAATHVVINIGGPHGTPVVVDEGNYVKHRTPKPRKKKV